MLFLSCLFTITGKIDPKSLEPNPLLEDFLKNTVKKVKYVCPSTSEGKSESMETLEVAIKIFPSVSEDFRRRGFREMLFAGRVANDRVVRVIGIVDESPESPLCVVYEWLGGGTLWKKLEDISKLKTDSKLKSSVDVRLFYALQAAHCVLTAHANHVVHGDIKPQNLVFDNEGKLKLIDFGSSRFEDATNTIRLGFTLRESNPMFVFTNCHFILM
jgi:serine/threonine protein kinase